MYKNDFELCVRVCIQRKQGIKIKEFLIQSWRKNVGINRGKVFKLSMRRLGEVKIVFEGINTEVDHLLDCTAVDTDFQEYMAEGAARFKQDNGLSAPAVDYLLDTMDWEIFADFRRNLDSHLMKNPLAILFHVTF